jgi:hypothetical protein
MEFIEMNKVNYQINEKEDNGFVEDIKEYGCRMDGR